MTQAPHIVHGKLVASRKAFDRVNKRAQKAEIDARRYFDALKRIAKDRMTPDQIRRDAPNVGLEYEEYLEMAYENMQQDARNAIHRKRRP